MVYKKFSTLPIKTMSVLGLALGLAMLNGNSGQLTTSALEMNDLIYPIIGIGVAMIIVFLFMREVYRSYLP
jgi:putative flippase GtrA